MKYFKYLSYVIRHKWFVFVECCKMGIIWRGLLHDLSKLLPDEFFPYVNYFYGNKKVRDETDDKAFDFAWLLHQKKNKHHWQWWILLEDNGEIKIFDMPLEYKKEMLADWKGAGRALGHGDDVREWYGKNKNKMQLHPETRSWIEKQIRYLSKLA